MDRLKLIDDIRKKALDYMEADSNLTYDVASSKAKKELTGENVSITKYHQGIDMKDTILEIAKRELGEDIRVELYQEEQLKEMIVANRLGVDVGSFVSIFLTPEQIHFITLATLKGEDVTRYMLDFQFDPEEEMNKLMSEESLQNEKGYQKVMTNNLLEAA